MFERRNITCTKCDESLVTADHSCFILQGEFYGLQYFTCYSCMKHFCYDCEDEDGEEYWGRVLRRCRICDKSYCRECSSMKECDYCQESYCKKCKGLEKCGECGDNYCGECEPLIKCGGSSFRCSEKKFDRCVDEKRKCDLCSIPFCDACCDLHECFECRNAYCGKCRDADGATLCNRCPGYDINRWNNAPQG